MKYLTKEWYNKMQCSDMHILLIIDKRAEKYSDEFYQTIYLKEKKNYIKEQSKVNKILLRKKENIDQKNTLDLSKEFDIRQDYIINELEKRLPKYILDEVKDIRILALNRSSEQVYNLIKKYSEENESYVDKKFRKYIKLEKETFKDYELDFLNTSFHDCYINKISNNGTDLLINFITGDLTEKENIIFENCKIIKDENIENSIWLYDEFYKINNKYEVHILTIKDDDLREMILECEEIQVK